MQRVILESMLTCPICGHAEMLTMPEDNCVWFHECTRCKTLLSPKKGDCCVFCSYGTVPCPPIQLSRSCCCEGETTCPTVMLAE